VKLYSSVLEMIRDTVDDPDFVADFEQRLKDTEIIRQLVIHRGRLGVTEAEMATRLGWSLDRLNEFEAGDDSELKIGEVVDYARAIGLKVNITFEDL
jgi:DNA-binding XRE family transcriptional regulator